MAVRMAEAVRRRFAVRPVLAMEAAPDSLIKERVGYVSSMGVAAVMAWPGLHTNAQFQRAFEEALVPGPHNLLLKILDFSDI
jgi:hypothetical protein